VARGSYFFWVQGNPRTEETDFRKAIELSRGANASAWAGLGDSLARIGRRDEAIAAYRYYLSIRPKSAAHYDGEIRKSIELLENNSSKP
jgi:tetratricopeptide (TPR) repeat protein